MNDSLKTPGLLAAICTFGLLLSACDFPESSADTRADVADARAEGRENVAEERRDASEDLVDAQQDMNEADADWNRESNQGARDVAVAQAEATHKVSTEKCEALMADQRDACKDAADRELERATTALN